MELAVPPFLLVSVLAVYFSVMNVALFYLMKRDKLLARHHKRRIPEKTLLTIGLLGGGFGGWIAMKRYHHKTKHWYFKWCYGANILVWVLAVTLTIIGWWP